MPSLPVAAIVLATLLALPTVPAAPAEPLAADDECLGADAAGGHCSLSALQFRGKKVAQERPRKPHIVLVLADDYGWANVGFHRRGPAASPEAVQGRAEVHTPNLDALADAGILLERHYTFKMCSPTRSSLISGRLPVHVNTVNMPTTSLNPRDPVSGAGGIPRNMTGLAEKLREGGYRTHMVGKWDVGMATPEHTPQGRGFETFLGYYGHANDYYRKSNILTATGELDNCLSKFVDFSINNATYRGGVQDATSLSHACINDTEADPACYEEHAFKRRALEVVRGHDVSKVDEPLFLFYSFHLVHTPLQVPRFYLAEIDRLVKAAGGRPISTRNRRLYAAMTLWMDMAVGELVEALKAKGMWDDTLLVFSADNGGPIYQPGAANNHPLKGGKYNDFEGGVRTSAFVSGGLVPQEKRGSSFHGIISVADWYATFCELAGVDPHDARAEAANAFLRSKDLPLLHAVDGVPQWSHILKGTNAREGALHLSEQAVIKWPYKLVAGKQPYARWQGELYPNCSGVRVTNVERGGPLFTAFTVFHQHVPVTDTEAELEKVRWTEDCGQGCLFDVQEDPTEHKDLAADPSFAPKLAELRATLNKLNEDLFSPDRGEGQLQACKVALDQGGYYGPFSHAESFWSSPPHQVHQKQAAQLRGLLENVASNISEMGAKAAAAPYFPQIKKVFDGAWDECLEE